MRVELIIYGKTFDPRKSRMIDVARGGAGHVPFNIQSTVIDERAQCETCGHERDIEWNLDSKARNALLAAIKVLEND